MSYVNDAQLIVAEYRLLKYSVRRTAMTWQRFHCDSIERKGINRKSDTLEPSPGQLSDTLTSGGALVYRAQNISSVDNSKETEIKSIKIGEGLVNVRNFIVWTLCTTTLNNAALCVSQYRIHRSGWFMRYLFYFRRTSGGFCSSQLESHC